MLLTEVQSARSVGAVSVALGVAVAVAPAQVGRLLGASILTGQDRYLGRQIGLDLAGLGTVLLTTADQRRPLQNVVVSAAALAGVTGAAFAKKEIPGRYATRMSIAAVMLGSAAALPLLGGRSKR